MADKKIKCVICKNLNNENLNFYQCDKCKNYFCGECRDSFFVCKVKDCYYCINECYNEHLTKTMYCVDCYDPEIHGKDLENLEEIDIENNDKSEDTDKSEDSLSSEDKDE